ncbi:MAG TPA: TMEM175 family protein [Lacunisphaera sp.]|nr:TMEM175 family protein [Lacunisphaera sp.]
MSRNRPRRPWRDALPGRRPEEHFHWRGKEVSRLEGLADAVFGFAVTLLIVAVEVPRTFEGLLDVVRGFPAFTVCFILLMIFWNAHYRFFRRYGLEDTFTRVINIAIMLLVLFSVYPLKFLFGAIKFLGGAHGSHIETPEQLRFVYTVYGLGFIGIWALYGLLYAHALRKRHVLQLTPVEVVQTREPLMGFGLNIVVCILSIILAHTTASANWPGMIYMLLGPLLTFNGMWHGRLVRRMAKSGSPPAGV